MRAHKLQLSDVAIMETDLLQQLHKYSTCFRIKKATSGSYPVCVRDVHDDGTRVATRHLVVLFDEAIGVGT